VDLFRSQILSQGELEEVDDRCELHRKGKEDGVVLSSIISPQCALGGVGGRGKVGGVKGSELYLFCPPFRYRSSCMEEQAVIVNWGVGEEETGAEANLAGALVRKH
jgi:hypothetical protein